MTNQARLWPEGEVFTREVLIPTKDGPLPVEVTYIVPPFDVVVEMEQNKDPGKNYDFLRQLIVAWAQLQEERIDIILKCYLLVHPRTYEAVIAGWYEYMREWLKANGQLFSAYNQTIN